MLVYSYAEGSNMRSVRIVDEMNNSYDLRQTEDITTRITSLYDSTGKCILRLEFNKTNGEFTNLDTGAQIYLSGIVPATSGPCSVLSDKDYEYEFCSLGDSYTSTSSVTVGEITKMVGATASVITIMAAIAAMAGVTVFSGSAKSAVETLASEILALYVAGQEDHTIDMTFRYKCSELWEADSSYMGGGFWYLGYVVDSSYFDFNI